MESCRGQTYFSHILRKNLTNCALDYARKIRYTIIAGKTYVVLIVEMKKEIAEIKAGERATNKG